MILASIDLETTGLDPETCQVLEVGAVLWDTSDFDTPVDMLPSFHCFVGHEAIRGQASALAMNARALNIIGHKSPEHLVLDAADVTYEIRNFVRAQVPSLIQGERAELWPTGFNFDSFDRQFLKRLPDFDAWIKLMHRSISPATLYFDPLTDAKIPSSDDCFKRAGIRIRGRHTALGDAQMTIETLRYAFRERGGCSLVPVAPSPDLSGEETLPNAPDVPLSIAMRFGIN